MISFLFFGPIIISFLFSGLIMISSFFRPNYDLISFLDRLWFMFFFRPDYDFFSPGFCWEGPPPFAWSRGSQGFQSLLETLSLLLSFDKKEPLWLRRESLASRRDSAFSARWVRINIWSLLLLGWNISHPLDISCLSSDKRVTVEFVLPPSKLHQRAPASQFPLLTQVRFPDPLVKWVGEPD